MKDIIETKNSYVIQTKTNQKNLYKQIEEIAKYGETLSCNIEEDKSHGRKIERKVSVFEYTGNKKRDWESVKSVIQVTRTGERGKKPYKEVAYYISNLKEEAQRFAYLIRGHWKIENQLHWVKDVILGEDKSRIKEFSASTNMSILKTIAINLFRSLGFISITEGQRWFSSRWSKSAILTT